MVPLPTVRAWLLSLLATQTLAATHELLAAAPGGWGHSRVAAGTEQIALQIGLVEQNIDQLESKLFAISTPGDAAYQQHMEKDDVDSLFTPSQDSVNKVTAWLKKNGVTHIHQDRSYINFATSVSTANKLLAAKFAHYTDGTQTKLRTLSYDIPDELTEHIDLVTPTTYFGKTRALAPPSLHFSKPASESSLASRAVDKSCSDQITPKCIKELYNLVDYRADPRSGSKIGFGSFLNESAVHSDLMVFEKNFSIPIQDFKVQLINGGKEDQSPDSPHGEANLDVQLIVGTSHPIPVTEFITGGSPPFIPNIDLPDNTNEPYLEYYNYLLSKSNKDLPQVISNSYGDDEETVPIKYATRVCNQIAKMGMRGISVLESSGDTGVGAGCKTNDGRNATRFTPQFPATCPYITAVGGTQSVSPEIAWVASSGGFSDYFKQPAYQKAAVTTYLTKYLPAATRKAFSQYADFSGRGFPDVSAHSLTPWYDVVANGEHDISGGTSAAAPVFSAIIALVNDALLRKGKKPLGFLNPFMYQYGVKGLTDITAGAAVGCNGINGQTGQSVPGGGIVPGAAWNATKGWDPSTGLGVPDFKALTRIAMEVCR
jgi:tripeptidyl-peptidase-1